MPSPDFASRFVYSAADRKAALLSLAKRATDLAEVAAHCATHEDDEHADSLLHALLEALPVEAERFKIVDQFSPLPPEPTPPAQKRRI